MASADPLGMLLSAKKKEQAVQPKAKAGGAPASAGFGLSDIGATLGRLRGAPTALSAPAAAPASLFGGPPFGSSPPPPAGGGSDLGSTWSPGDQRPAPLVSRAAAAPSGGAALGGGGLSAGGYAGIGPPPAARPAPQGGKPAGAVTFDDLLAGEKVLVTIKNCFFLVSNPLCEVRGRLLATNYRLKFQTPQGTLREELKWMQDARMFDLPLGAVEETKMDKSTSMAGMPELKLKVQTKDLRTLTFLLGQEEEIRNVMDAIETFGHPGGLHTLFAFKHFEESGQQPQDQDGWHIYDPSSEYARLGIETDVIPNPASPWRVSTINRQYGLCSSYPSMLALPRRMNDSDVRGCAGFRKRGRLPAMSWCGGPDYRYAAMWRCSQTTEGLMGGKSAEDEKMVECIRKGTGEKKGADRDLLVVDLRPWKSAWANRAGGGGFEGYARCRVVFGGIDNIHCVRTAWRAMGAAVTAVVEGEVGTWFKDVANSSWYDYIGAIMHCALRIISEIREHSANVLVHCSDGWDRTAQTTSLAMLCLDHHYRTQAGFLKLIQKEWCSFGHKFKTRLALGESTTGEYSPVFIQWLETVYQVWTQFPTAFEFTPNLLMRLAHEVVSNRYGTFLTDNEQERHARVMPNTMSLWTVLLRPEEVAYFQNPNYRPEMGAIIPSASQANYTIWEAYWFQYHKRGARQREVFAPPPRESQPVAPTPPPVYPELAAEAAASEAAASLSASPPPSDVGKSGLFSMEEVGATLVAEPPKPSPPRQVFNNDDDDDDIFTLNPKKKAPTEAIAEAREPPAPAQPHADVVPALVPDDEQLL